MIKPDATPAQIRFIEILAIDLGFSLRQRDAHIAEIVNRNMAKPDELLKAEASLVIDTFKEWKENK